MIERREDEIHMRENSCLDRIEWEGLQEPWVIYDINITEHIFQGSNIIEIRRDESYNIKAKISGTPKGDDKEIINVDRKPGKIIPTFQVTGASDGGAITYELNKCVLTGITYNTHDGQTTFEAPLLTSKVKKKFSSEGKFSWLTDWFLNGSNDILYYPRFTERNSFLNFERLRRSIDREIKKFRGGRSGSLNRDFAFIDAGEFQFIIARVPKGLGPNWSNSLGIEYRMEFGDIPNPNVREAIGEIVSFIIGRQLLNVGYSIFTNEGEPVEHVSFSPWGSNVAHLCQVPDNPPIKFKIVDLGGYEKTLSKVTQNYLQLRDELQLQDVLWQYWIAKNNPIGTNLPIFSSALETLAKSWFKSNKSKTQGVYMPKKDYDSLLAKEFKQIEDGLKHVNYGDRMYNRIRNAFQMGANERFQFFFDEISLPVGYIEEKAIKSRNKMAHGHSKVSEEDINEMITMTQAYETLIHRTLLKILGYQGSYIDRSSIGFPERKIDQPMLGLQK